MYVLNVNDLNTTNKYDNITKNYNIITYNCTINENNIDKFISILLLTIPCGLSLLCLISSMVYTLNKFLFKNI